MAQKSNSGSQSDWAAQAPEYDAGTTAPEVDDNGEKYAQSRDDEEKQIVPRSGSKLQEKYSTSSSPSSASGFTFASWWKRRTAKTRILIVITLTLVVLIVAIVTIVPSVYFATRLKEVSRSSDPVSPTPLPSPSAESSSNSSQLATVPPPAVPSAEAFWLLNTQSGGDRRSGVSWNVDPSLVLEGREIPSQYATVNQDNWVVWEGREHSVQLPHGTIFNVSIASLDGSEPIINARAGNATNGDRPLIVYRDDGRLLYSQGGVDYFSIYYCY